MSAELPAKRLAGFYFFYYAAVGALVPYLGLYLVARGMSPAGVGLGVGVLSMTRIFAPYAWGWWADRRGRRMDLVRLSLGLGLVCFALVGLAPPAALILMIAVYGLMVYGAMGQFEVVTFRYLAAAAHRYSAIRVWGSIGFIAVVLALGPVFDRLGVRSLPAWIAGMFLAAWLIGWRIPEPPALEGVRHGGSMWSVVRQRPVAGFLLACLITQISFGPYYGFLSIFLEEHGYRKTVIGGLWALAVVSEVCVFWFIPRFLPRLSLEKLFLAAVASSALRWAATPLVVDAPVLLMLVQLLHGANFGLYHLAAVSLIQRLFPSALQGRGQALYIGASYGFGGAVGGWLAGAVWASLPAAWIWAAAALCAVLAWWIADYGFRAPAV
jgi:PPP family 3-phenylpropionic acid transporter